MKINVTLKSFGNNEKYRGRATVVCRHRRCFLVRITIPLEIIDCRREIIDGSFLQNKGKTAYSRGLPLSKTAFTSNRRQLRKAKRDDATRAAGFRFVHDVAARE